MSLGKRLEKQEVVVIRETVVIVETRPGAFLAVSLITMSGVSLNDEHGDHRECPTCLPSSLYDRPPHHNLIMPLMARRLPSNGH